MSGAMLPFHLYALMEWRDTLALTLRVYVKVSEYVQRLAQSLLLETAFLMLRFCSLFEDVKVSDCVGSRARKNEDLEWRWQEKR